MHGLVLFLLRSKIDEWFLYKKGAAMQENINAENKNMVREPLIAGILSFLFMGLGQAYNGQRRKGYLFFSSYIILAVLYFILIKVFNESFPKKGEEISRLSPSYITTVICGFITWLFNIYDAYQSTKRINKGDIAIDSRPGKSAFIFLRNIVLGFIAFFTLLLLIPVLAIILAYFFKK